jgi:hypothetical protein
MYTTYMAALPKIKKPTELRSELFETLEKCKKGQSFLIPHKSGTSILMDEKEHSYLKETLDSLRAINRGLQDYLDGKTHPHSSIASELKKYSSKWRKKK